MWTGKFVDGYDVAFLQLSREVNNVPTPMIANNAIQVVANEKVYVPKLEYTLEIAQFQVVDNKYCPMMTELGANMFCIYSAEASMGPGKLLAFELVSKPINNTY